MAGEVGGDWGFVPGWKNHDLDEDPLGCGQGLPAWEDFKSSLVFLS